MKTKIPIFFLFAGVFFFISCEDEEKGGCTDPISYNYDSGADSDDGTCAYNYGGRAMGQIDVGSLTDMNNEFDIYINGEFIGQVNNYFPNGLSCGNPEAIGNIMESGKHRIRAVANGGSPVREGYINLSPQECLVVLLEDLAIVDNGVGDALFWINKDLECGPITVNLTGLGSSAITGYWDSTPDCSDLGAGGNFNDLPSGNYNFTAICENLSWSGTIAITDNACTRYQLYN